MKNVDFSFMILGYDNMNIVTYFHISLKMKIS